MSKVRSQGPAPAGCKQGSGVRSFNSTSQSLHPIDLTGNDILSRVKEYLKSGVETLRERHRQGASGFEIVQGYTVLIDTFLKTLFERIEAEVKSQRVKESESQRTAIVALGGYGRGELNIKSDIDLMLLYSNKLTPYIEKLTQRMLYILWDTGLDVGFSTRSVKECIKLAKYDLKTKTAILDAMFIAGEKTVFDEFKERAQKDVFREKETEKFIEEKMEESKTRHAKYGGSVYILEPNVKEGEGGLRDIHTALWIAKVKHGIDSIDMLAEKGFLLHDAAERLKASIDFLWRVRNELHFESKKKTDQLTFDHQERMARLFGFENTKESLAVEKFMQEYYRHASNLSYFSSLVINRCIHGAASSMPHYCKVENEVDGNFKICDGALTLSNHKAFEDSPENIMTAFEHCARLNIEMDNFTRERIIKNRIRVDDNFIKSRDVGRSFLNILKSGRPFETLQEMNRLRFLERYMPEFGDITCKVQHDMYHVYTVDTHSLFAVRELERLRSAEYKKDFFLLATLLEEVKKPEILALAVLLHDIGKSFGKGHAEKGAELVPKICGRLGMSEEDVAAVKFLVKYHLILADTAQYRDLHDERLIIDFAKTVGDIERLNLLYLLTFADVRAVGPEVWSHWKGALFQELYFKTLTVIERGTYEIEEAREKIPKIMQETVQSLGGEIAAEIVEDYFQLLPQRYFLANGAEAIIEHIKIVRQLGDKPHIMRVKQNLERQYSEVTICTVDVHGLFSKITGVMAANNINILGAQINTLKNGVVLDVLYVNSSTGEIISDERKWANVEKDLTDVLTEKILVERLVSRRGPSILDKKAKPRVHTRVDVDNEVSDAFTVIDIHTQDRIGLLYTITSTLSKLGLYIHIAKIATKGDAAADIFYVKDIFGQKIYYKERLKEIRKTIFEALGEKAPGEEEE
ncbi:MAG: [protein-PII] uridylyltransferase [Deltaproteobacteria bacterium RIFCSPLOWO2_12_FULL_43_16]|nr:MAG: [protein-PII] uridylyltransferase [Deltaproteobacteria bacterium GWA2_43_19]OGQ09654.1 MAG: [protein-PII] uridylyltransferase [Deltaproteobacteria bacterium RIFCSPHIGHO2_02_FULL_43_33]OGQ41257.1 MAG: [protein-PII] uridylyltransferase [Deltaproteobacteria bacterium RIFCSPLOWO2_01_FULL_42_9]OGQ57472.1 MAG: [protein-PII] uridylyltransferase [Deltaproteobacteria bacterium RIFCSPLOWO2_12_FULL_43_16]